MSKLQTEGLTVRTCDEEVLEAIAGPPQYGHGLGGTRPRLTTYLNFVGEYRVIPEEEANQRYAAGQPLAATFVNISRNAPGLGIAVGRPNVPSPIKESTLIFFPGIVAEAGDAPSYTPGELPFSLCYYALEGELVKS